MITTLQFICFECLSFNIEQLVVLEKKSSLLVLSGLFLSLAPVDSMCFVLRPTSGYGESREPRLRSRSPVHGRDSREHRDGREMREHSREPRPGPPRERDDDDRYKGSEGRDKDPHYR